MKTYTIIIIDRGDEIPTRSVGIFDSADAAEHALTSAGWERSYEWDGETVWSLARWGFSALVRPVESASALTKDSHE